MSNSTKRGSSRGRLALSLYRIASGFLKHDSPLLKGILKLRIRYRVLFESKGFALKPKTLNP